MTTAIRRLLLLLITVALSGGLFLTPSQAQTVLVKDIRTGSGSSNLQDLVNLNGKLFFTADDDVHGGEPWISDGTASGTDLVKDIYAPNAGDWPDGTIVVDGRAFFSALTGTTGLELWASDGTEGGTYLVKDINTSGDSEPSNLAGFNGRVFFAAEGDQGDEELWGSDGTSAGTLLFKDLYPGTYQNRSGETRENSGSPRYLTTAGNQLFFSARSDDGRELWVSDGTPAGTNQVVDLYPGINQYGNANAAEPRGLTPFGNQIVFSAYDADGNYATWISDGTASGTVKLAAAERNRYRNLSFVVHENKIFYDSGDHLWRSDGTAAGTGILVSNILAEGGRPMVSCGGWLFLRGVNSTKTGTNLWRSNGTAAGTERIAEIDINRDSWSCFQDRLYLSAYEPTHGRELYVSDGTTEGTTLVKDINPGGTSHSSPHGLVVAGETLYFVADDGTHGKELWKTDGNPTRLATLDPANLQPIDWSDLSLELIFSDVSAPVDVEALRDLSPPDASTLGLPDPQGLAIDALWTLTLSDPTVSFTADVCLGLDDLVPGLSPSELRLYKRPDESSTTWTELTTELRPASAPTKICAVGVTGFSQFAVTAGEGVLPVELSHFEVQQHDGRRARLAWSTVSETNNAGFQIERAVEGGPFIALGFVEGQGTTDTPQSYRFVDGRLPYAADSLAYRLRQVDLDGTATLSDEVVVRLNRLDALSLHAPFPNPAREGVTVRYELPNSRQATDVTISVYNVLGQRVAILTNGSQASGRVEQHIDTSRWPSGLYFVRLQAGGDVKTQRLVVVR